MTETTYYAVEKPGDTTKWCVFALTTDKARAFQIKRGYDANPRRDFPLIKARVVKAHPKVVQAYFLMGNKLW